MCLSQLSLAFPLIGFYEISIWLVRMNEWRRAKQRRRREKGCGDLKNQFSLVSTVIRACVSARCA